MDCMDRLKISTMRVSYANVNIISYTDLKQISLRGRGSASQPHHPDPSLFQRIMLYRGRIYRQVGKKESERGRQRPIAAAKYIHRSGDDEAGKL